MNRGELRDAMMALRSRGVPSTDTKSIATYNVLIDLAYKRLASEVPAALLPDAEHCVILPEYTTASTTASITKTADPFVMEFVPLLAFSPVDDGTWDGIYHLEITDGNGQVHRRQCREFWNAIDIGKFVLNHYVSLDRPWPATLTGNLKFRLYSPEFYTSDDITQVLDGNIWDPTRGTMMPLSEGYIHFTGQDEVRGDTMGRPQNLYRTRHFQLDAPNKAPVLVALANQELLNWGLEATGKFDYCYTYVWGKRDQERVSPDGRYDPMWESSPSPISSTITVPTDRHTIVDVHMPDIDWEVFFDVSGTIRATHSGLRKRLYRRRYTATGGAPLITNIESPELFQFLDEVDGSTETYTDDGSVVPGYYRRLPEVHGYYAWRAQPQQDARYEVDLRVLRRPRNLRNDYDAPRVQPDCIDALLQWAVYYFDQQDNNPEGAAVALRAAKEMTAQVRSRYAAPSAYVDAIPWDGTSPSSWRNWIGRARA